MSFFDIVLGGLLLYAFIMGIKNGFFVEIASFFSLIIGIYVAIKCSFFFGEIISKVVSWSPKMIKITAFIVAFIAVIIGIQFLAKLFTGIMNFAFLGWMNKLSGGFFRILKTILIVSVFLNLFEKINFNETFAKKETLDKSLFYRPIQKTAKFIFPIFETLYNDVKKK